MRKRRHHYVWQYYLKAWTTDGKLYCLSKNNIKSIGTKNIAVQKDFYKLPEITEEEIYVIKELIINKSFPISIRRLHEDFLSRYKLITDLKKLYDASDVENPEIESLIDDIFYNFDEDYHALIEKDAIKYIQSIRSGDLSFYQTEKDFIEFNYFISIQYFRTNSIKERMLMALDKYRFDIDKIWNICAIILATNVAHSLYIDRNKLHLYLLKNTSDVPLITSDQPIINTYGNSDYYKEPHGLEFYYPQNSKIAVLLSYSQYTEAELLLDTVKVQEYNQLIATAAVDRIYADQEEVLKSYVKYEV